jgi:5'-nucleotidase
MHILVSNDDGYQAPGLACLVEAMTRFGRVSVVAPDRDRSGASNSLTLERPLRVTTAENGFLHVNGTPTDCVHLAITGLLEVEPDMVISGINSGPNLGDDVIYSGTVAAAMEGRFLGFPALAVSLVAVSPKHFESAARAVGRLIERLQSHPLAADTILNINVPDCPWDEMKGFMATRLGHRHKSEPVTQTLDPRGRPIYWVGPAGPEQDAGPGTDFYAVSSGFVSVTPIQVDLTAHRAVEPLNAWLQGCSA